MTMDDQTSSPRDSAVVCANGQPLTVYHWTDMGDFDRFEHTNDIGFHFGTLAAAQRRREQVMSNSGPEPRNEQMIAAHLRIRNPLRIPDQHDWCPKNVIAALETAGILDDDAADEAHDAIIDLDWTRETLARAGYDGIVYDNQTEGGGDCWIVFDNDQICIIERQVIGSADGRASTSCPCRDPKCPGPASDRIPPVIPKQNHYDLGDAHRLLYGD